MVDGLGLVPPSPGLSPGQTESLEAGRYALGSAEARVETRDGAWRVAEAETDPISGTRIEHPPQRVEPLGGDVYGMAGGLLMSHRIDFPRPGVGRIGWVALPRVGDL